MRRLGSFLAVFIVAGNLFAGNTQHVIIVVVDGARYSETFGDPTHQFIPNIWSNLRPQATICTSYHNDGLTETNPGHATTVTGVWQNIANDGTVRPRQPTLFEYFRKDRGASMSDNFVVLGKTKLDILAYSTYPGYGSAYQASVKYTSSQYNDLFACDSMKSVLLTYHPRLAILNLPKTDNAAHTGVWSSYVSALHTADSLVYEIWNFVESDPIMKGKTTMIVTNDHGRHLDGVAGGFANHGDGCEGCRHIMLLAIGPDTPAGVEDSTVRRQIDVAPTVGVLLGFSTPYATGTVITSTILTHIAGEPAMPRDFSLSQNFPNPSNPSTTIRYNVGRESFVSLRIFDITGRVVAILVNSRTQPGTHTVTYDGSRLATGVYIYKIAAGEFVQAKKMLIVK